MHNQRGVRRAVAWMHFAKPRGHVGIESRDKRNARRAAEPRRPDAGDRKAQQKRKGRDDPYDSDAASHVTHRLNNALQHVDVALADRDEQRQRRADVERAGQNAAPGDGSGQSLLRIFDFVAHDGSELEPDQSEADHAEGIQDESRICGNPKVRPGDASAETQTIR